jgi:hypothetical protein
VTGVIVDSGARRRARVSATSAPRGLAWSHPNPAPDSGPPGTSLFLLRAIETCNRPAAPQLRTDGVLQCRQMATDGTDARNGRADAAGATPSPQGIFNLQKFQPLFEAVAKLLLPASGLLYSVGLLVSNVYFQQFGLSTFSLVRAQYVLVGLLWFLLIVLSLIMTAAVFDGVQALVRTWSSEPVKRPALFRKASWDLFSVGVTVYVGKSLLALLGIRDLSAWQYSVIVFIIESNFLVLALLASAIFRAVRGAEWPGRSSPVYIVSLCGAVLALLGGYSVVVFPYLDQDFGGGRLHKIDLILKPENVTALRKLGLDVSKDGRLGPVLLISEGSEGFLITTSQSVSDAPKAYWIGRNSVEAGRYTK